MQTIDVRRIPIAILVIASLSFASLSARAQEPECPMERVGCRTEAVRFHWREGVLDSFTFDTGWVPADAPLQLRFAVAVGGETEIDLAGTALAFWPRPLEVAVPGTPATGRLSIDYGLEVVARARFDVEAAGTRYRWEGDLPLGRFPRDLRIADAAVFDSMLLPPQTPRPVSVSDATEAVRVVEADLAGMIGIPGVGGGLAVDAAARLAAAYATDRIEIRDGAEPIREEGRSTVARPDRGASSFGPAKDLVIAPVGALDYRGTITLQPTFFVEVPGRRFEYPVAAIEIPVLMLGREVRFDAATVHVPLPDARVAPRQIDFGEVELGARATALLEVRSEGEAELMVTPRRPRAPFSVATEALVLPPRASRQVEVSFAPEAAGPEGAMLFVETSDPDQPLVVVRLLGHGTDRSLRDAGIGAGDAGPRGAGAETGAGCACRAGGGRGRRGGGAAALAVLAVAALAWHRRRPALA
jgi:MYXO-CTERM domain-containing protein